MNTEHAAGTVSVIVSAFGADTQPAAVHLADEVDDGLAIRVIGHDPEMFLNNDPGRTRRHLPTAAANDSANLAIVGPWSQRWLAVDIAHAEEHGIDVKHRLTLAPREHRHGGSVDHISSQGLGEIGDVAVQARDAVLRAGGHVQIEADDPTSGAPGGGMTAVRALVAAGIPPWASYVQDLTIWFVVSADVPALDDLWLAKIKRAVRVNGGPPPLPGNVAMMIALTGIEEHWPALAGLDHGHFERRVQETRDRQTGAPDLVAVRAGGILAADKALSALMGRISDMVGVPVTLVTTGPTTAIDFR